jgi:hypothetical protein
MRPILKIGGHKVWENLVKILKSVAHLEKIRFSGEPTAQHPWLGY